ncbi:MAG: DNA mismatch repair endonuclease MutL [Candidatus Gracilibacteria bacterium]
MPTIKVLPENLINQIAAGEVVERPASVVKELVENSLDAGAQRIIVEAYGGGDTFLRVTDDGNGMDKDDALLCFERHATSKISTADDLVNIHTLGFRGEAIASIASVSNMIVQTKKKGAMEGSLIVSEGGRMAKIKELGCPEGTQIEVRDLFFNTPVRKKYLKSDASEYRAIVDLF